ncbi:MAG: hypothetical protein WBW88_11060, partial [Rhodothermales bacterium]
MKRTLLVVSSLGISVLTLLIADPFSESSSIESPMGSAFPSEAMEGTEDNPGARAEYEFQLVQNPRTGTVPPNIVQREVAFARALMEQSSQNALTANEDWIRRGPYNVGGRSKALAIDVSNENVILAGSITSGIFKSTDGGNTWTRRTRPDQQPSVTCIVQNLSPGKQNVWYLWTGDRAPDSINSSAQGTPGTNSFYRGDGIYKSTDGGDTWTVLPSTVSDSPDVTDPFDYVFNIVTFGEDGVVAATGFGLYTSLDGGESWERIFGLDATIFVAPHTEVAVGSDGKLYAVVSGESSEVGVYTSTDGLAWTNISPPDWPSSSTKTDIGVSYSDPNISYFFTQVAPLQQQLRKYEVGVGWTDLTSGLPFNAQMSTYGGALLIVYVKPDDPNTVFLGAIDLFRSTDGGASFELISGHGGNTFHQDQVAIAFYPSNPKRMIVGNDGGLFRTADNKANTNNESLAWQSLNNGYLTTQFFSVAVDEGTSGSRVLIGGTQDNGVLNTDSPNPNADWRFVHGGDGGDVAITDGGQNFYFAQAATFHVFRQSGPNSFSTEITPVGGQTGVLYPRFQLDSHDQRVMYLPSRTTLWRNSNLTEIPDVQGGGPTDINWDTFENVTGHYIHAIGMSKASPRRLYYSASDLLPTANEKVFRLDNPQTGQPVPVDITGENFPFYPFSPYIACIEVDPRDSDHVMVVFSSYGELSIFESKDGGASWEPVSGNLEENPDGSGAGPS